VSGFDKGQLQIGQHLGQHVFFFLAQVPPRFFADHFELVDEDPGHGKVRVHRLAVGAGNLPEHERNLLRLHENEFDEAAGHLAGLLGILDFSHGWFLPPAGAECNCRGRAKDHRDKPTPWRRLGG